MKPRQILTIALIVLFGTIAFNMFVILHHASSPTVVSKQVSLTGRPSPTGSTLEVFGYKGHAGKDALSLLKAHATIAQNASGLVTTINDRKADDTKHEYWAFYVNGKLAQVGSAQYVTKDTDTIMWQIEHY